VLPLLAICLWVGFYPHERTVTGIYHEASTNWWAQQDIYQGPGGLNYLPHFVLVFTPFHLLPVPAGDLLWRLLTTALLASAIWRLLRDHFGEETARVFAWASLLALPACLGAVRNGQGSALFAAITLHAVACLPRRQWWAAAALMVLAVAVRPIGIVLILLAPFIYAPLRWRLPALALAFAVVPFFFAPPDYVIAQYRDFATNIHACSVYKRPDFADFNGVIRTFGSEVPSGAATLVNVLAGGLTLALWWFSAARIREPFRALWLLALATGYLMLFNPMNEVNSYVILAPAMGAWVVHGLRRPETRRFGYWVAFLMLTIGFGPDIMFPFIGNRFGPFWLPIATALFLGLLTMELWQPRPPFAERGVAPPHDLKAGVR
jgi:hypothetical protein